MTPSDRTTKPVPTPRPGCSPKGLFSTRFVVTLTTAGRTRCTTATTGSSLGAGRGDAVEDNGYTRNRPTAPCACGTEHAVARAATANTAASSRFITPIFVADRRLVRLAGYGAVNSGARQPDRRSPVAPVRGEPTRAAGRSRRETTRSPLPVRGRRRPPGAPRATLRTPRPRAPRTTPGPTAGPAPPRPATGRRGSRRPDRSRRRPPPAHGWAGRPTA